MSNTRTVIKISGGLLDKPERREALRRWASESLLGGPAMLIPGGGKRVDQLREHHACGALDDRAAHWAAIDVMNENAGLLAELLAFPLTDKPRFQPTGPCVFAPARFLMNDEPKLPGRTLPVGWETTSDSIAARVACVLDADLLLLKAKPPGENVDDLRKLAEHGYVDAEFPFASLGIRHVDFQTLE